MQLRKLRDKQSFQVLQVGDRFFCANAPCNLPDTRASKYGMTVESSMAFCLLCHVEQMFRAEGKFSCLVVFPWDMTSLVNVRGPSVLLSSRTFLVNPLSTRNMLLRSIINNVLNVFRPKRWVLTMVADKAGLSTITENPFNVEQVNLG